ncbi:hypothetical protein Pfo_006414 [Paulownia fortunei]|nr:hypothetical protein Pfo_006414 [Paulownia fortunei]
MIWALAFINGSRTYLDLLKLLNPLCSCTSGLALPAAMPMKEEVSVIPSFSRNFSPSSSNSCHVKHDNPACKIAEHLFVPGTLYYIKRNVEAENLCKPGNISHC